MARFALSLMRAIIIASIWASTAAMQLNQNALNIKVLLYVRYTDLT